MERLTNETLNNAINTYKAVLEVFENSCMDDEDYNPALDKCTLSFLEELKQYRDAEEQGLLLKLPRRIGSMVYEIKKDINQMKRETIEHNGHYYYRNIDVYFITQVTFEIEDISSLGKTVFLTKEEAEAALEEMKGE